MQLGPLGQAMGHTKGLNVGWVGQRQEVGGWQEIESIDVGAKEA